MSFQHLLLEIRNKILFITINRESKLNALNKETLKEINLAVTNALLNEHIGGIIITGSGPKAFIAGADISEFENFDAGQARNLAVDGQNTVFNLIEAASKPIIAAINGFALGGGLELAMACHIRIASTNAMLGLPEVSLGIIPGYGGTQRLTQLVGKGKAMEMILTGNMIDAENAFRCGLINYSVAADELINKAEEIMHKILTRAPLAISAAIKSVNASLEDGVNGYDIEISSFANCFTTEDFKEGVSAFLNKRTPDFKGR